MKCLTICQPYAHFIAITGEKRVENRDWYTSYRGQILIHAGKSREWLRPFGDSLPASNMSFGALIGVADLADCLNIAVIEEGKHDIKYPWLYSHKHTEGPFCWVLPRVWRFGRAISWKGSLGLFDVPDSAVAEAIATATELHYPVQ